MRHRRRLRREIAKGFGEPSAAQKGTFVRVISYPAPDTVASIGIDKSIRIIRNRQEYVPNRSKMPLATSDRLRFIEFLGLIAGLLIVFVSTTPVYFPFELPSESVLVLLLILFIAYSLFVYAEILSREKSSTKFMFSAALYFTVILSLLFSGTILKAFAAQTSTSPTIGAFLFIALVISYNIVILIPMQKIMKDEPPKSENQSRQGESKVKE